VSPKIFIALQELVRVGDDGLYGAVGFIDLEYGKAVLLSIHREGQQFV
jgi:hypothetical protein